MRRWRAEWPLLLLLTLCGASLPLLIHPYYDAVGDGSIYLATARSLLEGEGYRYLDSPYRVRPPGLSLLLVPALAVFGRDPLALNALMACFGILAVALVFVWARPRLGQGLAFLLALSIWLNPGFQKYSMQILSDVPGLAALMGGLLLARWADRRPSIGREVVLGAFVGVIAHLRTASILLLPAVALARALRFGPRRRAGAGVRELVSKRMVPMIAAAAIVMAPWAVRNDVVAEPGITDQLVIYDYATAQWRADANDPDSPRLPLLDVLARAEVRSQQIVRTLGTRMGWGTLSEGPDRLRPEAREWAISLVLLLGLLYGALVLRDEAALLALGLLAVLLVYFDYHARLALPVYVIALAFTLEGAQRLLRLRLEARPASVVLAAVLALLIVVDFDLGRAQQQIAAKHLDLEERCLALSRALPEEARLATTVGWHYNMCLERPVFLIAQRVMMESEAAAAEKVIDRHRVEWVFLDRRSAYDRRFAPYFRAVYGEPRRAGQLDLWRVRGS